MTFSQWFDKHGEGLNPDDARAAWSAALDAAIDRAERRAAEQHGLTHARGLEAEYAGTKWLEGRAYISLLDMTKARPE